MMTIDGKPLFDGAELFELKATHGFPLDFVLDRIINEEGWAIHWPGFIDAARRNQWPDYRTLRVAKEALIDAYLPRGMADAIEARFKLYVLEHPQSAF